MPITTAQIQDLIQETIQKILVQPLEAASTFLSSGVRIFDTASPITIPKLVGSFSPDWIGESELIPEETGPTFDSVPLLPSTMKSIKSIIRLSNESLRQSTLALDSVLQDRLIKDVSGKLDAQAWSGLGDGTSTPKGVLHPANVAQFATIDLAGAAIDLDDLHDAYGTALGDDIPLSGLRWVLSPTMLTSLRKIKDTTGRYIVTDDIGTGPAGLKLLGVPVILTKRLAPSGADQYVMLWTPSSWAVARDLSPQATLLKERWAEYDETGLRVVTRFDWAPLQGEANVLIENAAPAAP